MLLPVPPAGEAGLLAVSGPTNQGAASGPAVFKARALRMAVSGARQPAAGSWGPAAGTSANLGARSTSPAVSPPGGTRGMRVRRSFCFSLLGKLTMPPALDLTGRRFGRLTAIRRAGTIHRHWATWRCLCECGRRVTVRAWCLISGTTRSCGCLRVEVATEQIKRVNGSRSRSSIE